MLHAEVLRDDELDGAVRGGHEAFGLEILLSSPILLEGIRTMRECSFRASIAFRNLFGEVARRNNMAYIPFLLKGVAGVPHLNLYDRVHPNAEGHKILAETVWEVLSAVL